MDLEQRVAHIDAQLKLVEHYTVRAFWQALDRAYDSLLPKIELRCIVCDHRDGRSGFRVLTSECQFGGGRLERYQCPKCEAVFGPQKYLDLDESFVTSDYDLLYSRYTESNSTVDELNTFGSLQPAAGKLYLNWGCGTWNETIQNLRRDGFDVWGYEPSAPRTEGVIVKNKGEISAKFNGIFSNNVIEHFREPVAQFLEFKAMLTDDGVMAHSSPCYDYVVEYTRFHTLFLTGKSPHVLAERAGFRAQEVARSGIYVNYAYRPIA